MFYSDVDVYGKFLTKISPFNKRAGSIVTHSFLALELCGSLDTHNHTIKKHSSTTSKHT